MTRVSRNAAENKQKTTKQPPIFSVGGNAVTAAPNGYERLWLKLRATLMACFGADEAAAKAAPVKQPAAKQPAEGVHAHPEAEAFRKTVCAYAIMAVAVKLAQADGPVSRKEMEALPECHPILKEKGVQMSLTYAEALKDLTPAEHYIRQIDRHASGKKFRRSVVEAMFRFAAIDGQLSREEVLFLYRLVKGLRMEETDFVSALRTTFEATNDPFACLGVARNVTQEALKKAYRAAVSRCHPDHFPDWLRGHPEVFDVLNQRISQLTDACHEIRNRRGFA